MGVKISVIMVDGGFRENFKPLETWLSQRLLKSQYELIWVEYTKNIALEVKANPEIRCFSLDLSGEPQVLARAYNEGIRQAHGEIIVLPDADVTCQENLLEIIFDELSKDPEVVLYILRLDQPKKHFREDQSLAYLQRTCSIKHTYNYGGCTAIRREWLIKMNGYEQLPFFSGYHYNGGDNYIRFKNMGLKVRWHPTQRVYHAWHPIPPVDKFNTTKEQDRFIQQRAANWDWLAYDGLDPGRNRPYDPESKIPSEWPLIMTERGSYSHLKNQGRTGDTNKSPIAKSFQKRAPKKFAKKSSQIFTKMLKRLGFK